MMHRLLVSTARRRARTRMTVSAASASTSASARRFLASTTGAGADGGDSGVTAQEGEFSDRCSLNVVSSPFPPIAEGPYPPLYEFVTENWLPHDGYLDEKIAIIDGSTGLQRTFKDYYQTTGGLAGALHFDFDVTENDCVAVFSPNHVDYAPIILAVALCGAKVTPINPMYTHIELEKVLERSRSKVLIAHKSTLETALQSAKNVKTVKHIVVITDDEEDPASVLPEGTIDLNYLRQHGEAFDATVHEIHRKTATHPVCLPYSSGTTGECCVVVLEKSERIVAVVNAPFAENSILKKSKGSMSLFHILKRNNSRIFHAFVFATFFSATPFSAHIHRPAERRLFDPFQSRRQSPANGGRRRHPLCGVAQTHFTSPLLSHLRLYRFHALSRLEGANRHYQIRTLRSRAVLSIGAGTPTGTCAFGATHSFGPGQTPRRGPVRSFLPAVHH